MDGDNILMTYDLTPYTGKGKGEHRQAVVARYSVSQRDLMIVLIACGVALLVVVVTMFLVGYWSILAFPIVILAIYWFSGQVNGDKLQVNRIKALDNTIGARRGRGVLNRRGDSRGLNPLTGVILVSGRPLVAPTVVNVEQIVIRNPHYGHEKIARASAVFKPAISRPPTEDEKLDPQMYSGVMDV